MQVKKFEAPTMQEALDHVKRELGPEAIILQTKNHKRGFGLLSKPSVEITAAVSERSMSKKTKLESRMQETDRNLVKNLPAARQASLYEKYLERRVEKTQDEVTSRPISMQPIENQKRITATRYIDIAEDVTNASPLVQPRPQVKAQVAIPQPVAHPALEQEVRELKQMIEDMKGRQSDQALPHMSLDIPALQDVFEQLVVNGLDRRYALALIKKAAFTLGSENSQEPEKVLDAVADELMETITVVSPFEQKRKGPMVISFIGPTGVGKTTTLAKIASEAQQQKQLKVGLINLDYYKITSFDQLATYGKILHVPFRSVASVEDLKAALLDFHNLDVILVDTTGRSHRDPQSLKEIQELLSAVPEVMTFLVLSATTRDSELFDAAGKFSAFHPKGLIFSKLDEVIVYGGIYNLIQRIKLPLLYFTTGQKVPDDIEKATAERLVSLLLDF